MGADGLRLAKVSSRQSREMALPGLARMTAAELLEVVDGEIVRGELIYDAEALRRVTSQAGA